MKKNNKGFSLIIAIGIVIVISLLAYTVLEYIIPFSRDIKGVENSSIAFYKANSGIEEGLYDVYKRNYGVGDTRQEYSYSTGSLQSYNYSTTSSGSKLPPPGEGNSEYDYDRNTISSGNPIQLLIGNGNFITSEDFKIYLRVPDLNTNDTNVNVFTLSGGSLPIVNWQLNSSSDSLNSSGSIITANDINTGEYTMNEQLGDDLSGTQKKFKDFYDDNCGDSGSGCTLKFSIINKLETDDGIIVPYLECIIDLGDISHTSIIPLSYTKIESSGKSFGFKKDLDIKVPSLTVSEAFDFTVFQ